MKTLYCHGLPGGASDFVIAGLATDARPRIVAPIGDDTSPSRSWEGSARLVAFSLGAYSALTLASAHPDRVRELVLISPAAPLELGDFLSHMAGAPVFRAAKGPRSRLVWLTRLQSAALAMAPNITAKALFANATPSERTLMAQPENRAALLRGMRQSYGTDRDAYLATLRAYVRPWSNRLDSVTAPVRILHGTADGWAAPAMAEALADKLGTRVEWQDDLGHYGTLRATLPRMLPGQGQSG